jgi:hypothetical protein
MPAERRATPETQPAWHTTVLIDGPARIDEGSPAPACSRTLRLFFGDETDHQQAAHIHDWTCAADETLPAPDWENTPLSGKMQAAR